MIHPNTIRSGSKEGIDDIIIDRIHYQLYSINDFFVEVHYDAANNKLIGKQAFKQGQYLNKYLYKLWHL